MLLLTEDHPRLRLPECCTDSEGGGYLNNFRMAFPGTRRPTSLPTLPFLTVL